MSKLQLHASVLIVLLALTLVGTLKARSSVTNVSPPRTDFSLIPVEFDSWYGIEDEFSEETQRLLPSASLLLRYYTHSTYDGAVELAIVYGTNLGDFHQPEVCLEGQGWRSLEKYPVPIQDTDGTEFDAMSIVMEHGYGLREVFLYWFYSNGVASTSLGNYKIQMLWDRIMSREIQPSAMIRLSTQVSDEDDEAAVQLLKRFTEDVLPYLKKEFAREREDSALAPHTGFGFGTGLRFLPASG